MINNIRNIYFLASAITIIILLLNTCGGDIGVIEGENPEVISLKKTITNLRTNHEHYKDSTVNWIKYDFTEVPQTKPSVIYRDRIIEKEVLGMDLSDTSEFYSDLRTFYYGKKDSLLKYDIRVISRERPEKIEMEYEVLRKTFTDSIYVKDSTHTETIKKVRVNQVFIGIASEVSPLAGSIGGTIDIISKKGFMIGAEGGYDLRGGNKYLKAKLAILITFRGKNKNKILN